MYCCSFVGQEAPLAKPQRLTRSPRLKRRASAVLGEFKKEKKTWRKWHCIMTCVTIAHSLILALLWFFDSSRDEQMQSAVPVESLVLPKESAQPQSAKQETSGEGRTRVKRLCFLRAQLPTQSSPARESQC